MRELENVIERGVIFADDRPIDLKDLPFAAEFDGKALDIESDLKSALREFEREYILQALKRNNFDKMATARELDIGLSSLYRKMDELGMAKREGSAGAETPLQQCEPR